MLPSTHSSQSLETLIKAQHPDWQGKLCLFEELDSTNKYLLEQMNQLPMHSVIWADQQSHAYGQRGRSWQSPSGNNIYLSMSASFDNIEELRGLSIALGISLVQMLNSFGRDVIKLKWPNDLVSKQRKLGGLLVETRLQADGAVKAVIGLGLNLYLDEASHASIDQAATDLQSIYGVRFDRTLIALKIITTLLASLKCFIAYGFSPFQSDWASIDALHGLYVKARQSGRDVKGVVLGIDAKGALVVADDLAQHIISNSDIPIREQKP